ncbi:hypothetical protein; putative exported protein [Xenorhabdus nematophila ATCC 19061]|uniref:Uncharacterized protein n=1 Tax=Xenorhabdus nematophila (strain ATCC 19061 / DSM 3370 / CCUG 14189 / LMG 1036 / NCIMB 9965 / AN6) TaxID=406817 RepID=D3VDU6_XENNA|nr:hypothetical protein; putative exported protein [Xenorhabdus nematophila ATCC 19061]
MKKYILLCLLAGTTLLASMQTYALVCSIRYPIGSQEWKHCTVYCVEQVGPIGVSTCL